MHSTTKRWPLAGATRETRVARRSTTPRRDADDARRNPDAADKCGACNVPCTPHIVRGSSLRQTAVACAPGALFRSSSSSNALRCDSNSDASSSVATQDDVTYENSGMARLLACKWNVSVEENTACELGRRRRIGRLSVAEKRRPRRRGRRSNWGLSECTRVAEILSTEFIL